MLFLQSRFADVADGFCRTVIGSPCSSMSQLGPDGLALSSLLEEGSTEPLGYEPDPGDVCYLMCTSGTTGTPRAAMLTHGGQFLDAEAVALEMGLSPDDRHLATMPLFHVGGRAIVLGHTLRGCHRPHPGRVRRAGRRRGARARADHHHAGGADDAVVAARRAAG